MIADHGGRHRTKLHRHAVFLHLARIYATGRSNILVLQANEADFLGTFFMIAPIIVLRANPMPRKLSTTFSSAQHGNDRSLFWTDFPDHFKRP